MFKGNFMTRSIAQLRAAGFIVEPAPDAQFVTQVVSTNLFWHYNALHYNGMVDTSYHFEQADRMPDGRYRLLVAGANFNESEPFVYGILNDDEMTHLTHLAERSQEHQRLADSSAVEFASFLKSTS